MMNQFRWTERGRRLASALVFSILVLFALAPTAFAQGKVLYTGTLAIGFGDPANGPAGSGLDLANNGLPACANANPFAPATIATVSIAGYATQGAPGGPAASLMFPGYSPIDFVGQAGGGQVPITTGTCIVQFPPFVIPSLRSRVQAASQVWPGDKLNAGATAFTGTPGGTLSVNGGNAGGSFAPLAFYGANETGMQTVTPNLPNFGGGVPVNFQGGVQLGVNFPPQTNNGDPLKTFGIRDYAEGFLPTDPAAFGTSATNAADPAGVRVSNEFTWRVRTAGPASGPSQTPPLPLTVNGGFAHGAQATAFSLPVTTMGDFSGIFQKWTTGMVRHSDAAGTFTTVRSATGFDTVPASPPNGTTRRLQLVTPWSASIQKQGTGPFAAILDPLPDFGFGGVAVLNLDITPVPEPGVLSMLGFGAAGLLGLAAIRRRHSHS